MPDSGDGPQWVLTEQQAAVREVCEVCGWDDHMMAGRAARLLKGIRDAGGDVALLVAHYGQVDTGEAWWWWRDYWLGRKGEWPQDYTIRATWGLWDRPIAVRPASAAQQLAEYARRHGQH